LKSQCLLIRYSDREQNSGGLKELTRTQYVVRLFLDYFVNRQDCYPLQYTGNGAGYRVVREELTDQVVLSHLKGEQTIGLYSSPKSTTKWLCIDIDDLQEAAVREVQNHARRFNIPYLTELSGKKGYHLWVFFNKLYPSKIARTLASAFAFDHEVFPKQDLIPADRLGSLVKAPLGKHQITSNWCLFLSNDLKPEKDQYETLGRVPRINPIEILKKELPETWHQASQNQSPTTRPDESTEMLNIPIIKDCIRNAIMTGTSKGKRNHTGHIIATELRTAGILAEHAEAILQTTWNPRNKPPLNPTELQHVIQSAYGKKQYTYGCKNGSPLRQHLECVSRDNCFYMTTLKSIQSDT
jgi:hypothetical protein